MFDVAAREDGSFLVAWEADAGDLVVLPVVRRFDVDGDPISAEVPIPSLVDEASDLLGVMSLERDGSRGFLATLGRSPWGAEATPRVSLTRRFCTELDTECPGCASNLALDTDSDGTPDECDPCTDLLGAASVRKLKVRYLAGQTEVLAKRSNKVKVTAEFTLPP
jgi:hypothetical protein